MRLKGTAINGLIMSESPRQLRRKDLRRHRKSNIKKYDRKYDIRRRWLRYGLELLGQVDSVDRVGRDELRRMSSNCSTVADDWLKSAQLGDG